MSARLEIRDESGSGKVLDTFFLVMPNTKATVREIITARVRHEVDTYNRGGESDTFRGLVMPEGAEIALNGFKLKKRRTIDAEQQVTRALDAFGRNAFFLIVDDAQVEDLEQSVEISPLTKVSFVRLVQLVGG
jgi:hypothetical protein